MKSNLPAPTAKAINDAHQCAKESAENAVEWAVKCGQLLAAKKDSVGHGNWEPWVRGNCDFSDRAARKYMQLAQESEKQNGMLMPFSTMDKLLGYEKPKPKELPKGAVSVVNPEGGRTTGAKEGTEETGADRPAAPVSKPEVTPEQRREDDAPERPSDEEFAAIDREIQESEARVLRADDVTAGYHDELKRQATELAAVKLSRDGYMDGKAAITKLLQAEQRKNAKLTKRIQELEKENQALRQRLSITEAA